MSCEQVAITGSGLPNGLGPEIGDYFSPSQMTFELLGPVINEDTLRAVEASLLEAPKATLQLTGYLRVQGYQILTGARSTRNDRVYEYLKPIACSFTELALSATQISSLPDDDDLIDRVMEIYISNLLDDLAYFTLQRFPHKNLRLLGNYLSRRQGRLLPCEASPRKLTPRFGTLAFVVEKAAV